MPGINEELFRRGLEGKSLYEVIEAAVAVFREKEDAVRRLAEFEKASTEMAVQFQQMKDELKGTKAELEELRKQNRHMNGTRIIQARELFGRSTEKTGDIVERALRGVEDTDPIGEDTMAEEGSEGSTSGNPGRKKTGEPGKKIKKGKKKPGKKENDLSRLPITCFYDYDVEEFNHLYGEGNWRFSFWEGHDTVELIRQTCYVKRTYTPILSIGEEHILSAVPYETLLPKSLVSSSLLAMILKDTFILFLPLYRQENDEDRFGFPLSRQTMSNWILRFSQELFQPVYEYMCSEQKKCRYQQCDETTWEVINDGRAAGTKSYIWLHRTSELAEGPEIIVYCFEKTRAANHLISYYQGITDKIYLSCDAFSSYPVLEKTMDGLVTLCGCYMHVRRRYVEALDILNVKNMENEQFAELPEVIAIDKIRSMYITDNKLKALPVEIRTEKRSTEAKKEVDDFFEYIKGIDLKDPVMTDKMKDAVQYSLNNEDCLRVFLQDGHIPIDNGAAERSIRAIAQLRKSRLFSTSIAGAEAMAVCCTLGQTAAANGADPYYYYKYLLEEIPKHRLNKDKSYLADMMPWSAAYREWETREKQALVNRLAPKGNERPQTPRKIRPAKKAG